MASSSNHVEIESNVVYGDAGNRPLRCDIYNPHGKETGRPAVLLIHGGGWSAGDKEQLRGYGILLGRQGYVCVACEYRLNEEAPWPAQIHDVKAAIRWMRTNHERLGIDPDQIAVEGNSAGAHLALFAAATPDDDSWEGQSGNSGVSSNVAAAIGFYTPTFFGEATNEPAGAVVASALLRDEVTVESMQAASPLTYARPDFPPVLLIHGNDDLLVPDRASILMYEALQSAGASVELHIYSDQPHGFDKARSFGRQSSEIMLLFLDRYVSGRQPVQADVPPETTGEDTTLDQISPDITWSWHPTKNGIVTPKDIMFSDGYQIWWICDHDATHTWQANPRNRIRYGCPICMK